MTWDWHHLDFAHASSILHIATDFGQSQGSHPRGLHVLYTSQCGSQNPKGVHAQMCTSTNWTGFWTKGTNKCTNTRDYSPVGCASWMCLWANAYTWLSGRKHKWTTRSHSLLQPAKVSSNYYDITHLHIQLCIIYTLINYIIIIILYSKYYVVLFLSSTSTQYYLLSLIIFAIHVYNSPSVLYLYLLYLKNRIW